MHRARGAWVAQSVECQTLAQVMISQFVRSSPMSGSVLTSHLQPSSRWFPPVWEVLQANTVHIFISLDFFFLTIYILFSSVAFSIFFLQVKTYPQDDF